MDININDVVFEKDLLDRLYEPGKISNDIMTQFLESGYFENDGLNIDRFLDKDKTIDIEKLELGVSLAIEYLEKSVKYEKPIYVFLRNMDKYFEHRGISPENLSQIKEESSFILGFCQSVADEESSEKVIIKFASTEE